MSSHSSNAALFAQRVRELESRAEADLLRITHLAQQLTSSEAMQQQMSAALLEREQHAAAVEAELGRLRADSDRQAAALSACRAREDEAKRLLDTADAQADQLQSACDMREARVLELEAQLADMRDERRRLETQLRTASGAASLRSELAAAERRVGELEAEKRRLDDLVETLRLETVALDESMMRQQTDELDELRSANRRLQADLAGAQRRFVEAKSQLADLRSSADADAMRLAAQAKQTDAQLADARSRAAAADSERAKLSVEMSRVLSELNSERAKQLDGRQRQHNETRTAAQDSARPMAELEAARHRYS